MPANLASLFPYICFLLALTVAPSTFAQTSPRTHDELQRRLETLATQALPGSFGIAVVDLRSGEGWGVHAARGFLMMSDFKAPVVAAVLARIDAGGLSATQTVALSPADVVEGSAVPSVGDQLKHGPRSFSVDRLMMAAVTQSDNTAVDALLRLLGGPEQVTRFLALHGIEGMHIRDGEGGVNRIVENLRGAAAPPPGETQAQENLRRELGYRALLANPPNQTTPEAAALFLGKLWRGELLSAASTHKLIALMESQTVPRRLAAGLGPQVRLAQKTGTGVTVDGRTAAWNDIGLLSWPDGRTVAIAGYLADAPATDERDTLFAGLAHAVSEALEPR